jgi:hypothetical protein
LPPGYNDAAYVMVIGVCAGARGQRIGAFLLGDAVARIHKPWGGGMMPPVWALVAPANAASVDFPANIRRPAAGQHAAPRREEDQLF